jgi:hypothetical protein
LRGGLGGVAGPGGAARPRSGGLVALLCLVRVGGCVGVGVVCAGVLLGGFAGGGCGAFAPVGGAVLGLGGGGSLRACVRFVLLGGGPRATTARGGAG